MTVVAALGEVGKVVGQANIGKSDNSYMFQVSLPGVKSYDSKLLMK